MTKPLHGQFLRETREVADSKSWAWLTSGNLKKKTQDQALRTNVIKVKIEKQEGDVRCRICKEQRRDSCALNERMQQAGTIQLNSTQLYCNILAAEQLNS